MLGAINKKNGGTHDTNIQVYEHTGKKLKRIKYSRLCVCVCVCVCVHKYICKNACMCVCVCVCE